MDVIATILSGPMICVPEQQGETKASARVGVQASVQQNDGTVQQLWCRIWNKKWACPEREGTAPRTIAAYVYQMKVGSYVKQVQNDANVIKVPAGEISSANPGQKHGDQ